MTTGSGEGRSSISICFESQWSGLILASDTFVGYLFRIGKTVSLGNCRAGVSGFTFVKLDEFLSIRPDC